MAKVKQSFGETRFVPGLGREVEDGEVIEVPDGELASYLEGGWRPADKQTTAAHQQLLADGTVTVGTLRKPPKTKAETETDTHTDTHTDSAEPADGGESVAGDQVEES